MPSSCPICDARQYRTTIETLAGAGGDLAAVKQALLDRGVRVSTYLIRKHFKEHSRLDPAKLHGSICVPPSKKQLEEEAAQTAQRKEEVKEYLDSVATIDIERVMKQLGIDKTPSSIDDILDIGQKIAVGLHVLAGVSAYDRLERYTRDPEGRRYPNNELRGVRITHEMYSQAFGLTQLASLQSAVETCERAGFQVVAADAATLEGEVVKGEETS